MNELLQTYALLNQAMHNDPLLCLAQAVCWLDPLWRGYNDDFEYDEDGILSAALVVTRQSFPDLYVDAVDKTRQGASYAAVDQLICEGISATGIPLDNLEHLPYGIPLPAYGVMLDDPEFYALHPDILPVLECFGIVPEPQRYHVDVPERAYSAAQIIADDLQNHPDEQYQQVSWMLQWVFSCSNNSCVLCGIKTYLSRSEAPTPETILQSGKIYSIGGIIAESLEQQESEAYQQLSWTVKWLFSCSNNSCVDWDAETMYSVEPLAWTPEDVAFAVEIIAEAETIMADAVAGLAWVKEEAGVLLALCYNAQQIYQMLANNPEEPVDVSLMWPDLSQDSVSQIKTLLEEWGCLLVQST